MVFIIDTFNIEYQTILKGRHDFRIRGVLLHAEIKNAILDRWPWLRKDISIGFVHLFPSLFFLHIFRLGILVILQTKLPQTPRKFQRILRTKRRRHYLPDNMLLVSPQSPFQLSSSCRAISMSITTLTVFIELLLHKKLVVLKTGVDCSRLLQLKAQQLHKYEVIIKLQLVLSNNLDMFSQWKRYQTFYYTQLRECLLKKLIEKSVEELDSLCSM